MATRISGRKPAKRVARNDRRFQSSLCRCNTDSGQCITSLVSVTGRDHSDPVDTILHQVYMYTGPTYDCMPREPAHPAGVTGPVSPSPARRHPPEIWRIRATPATCRSASPPRTGRRPAIRSVRSHLSTPRPIPLTASSPVRRHRRCQLTWRGRASTRTRQDCRGLDRLFPAATTAVLSSQLPTHHSLSVHQPA